MCPSRTDEQLDILKFMYPTKDFTMVTLEPNHNTDDVNKLPTAPLLARSDIMRPKSAAMYLNMSLSRLAKLRMASERANGPRFFKVAGCVLYRRDDLDAWVNAHAVGVV